MEKTRQVRSYIRKTVRQNYCQLQNSFTINGIPKIKSIPQKCCARQNNLFSTNYFDCMVCLAINQDKSEFSSFCSDECKEKCLNTFNI